MSERFEYTIDSSRRKVIDFKELWQYRELFYFFAWRDIKVKYKQTVLGIFWVVLQPVLTVIVFSLFFSKALNVPSIGLPYPVFVFSGLLFWNTFASCVNNAGNSMISNAPIIKKIYFPRLILPVSSILSACIDFLFAFIVLVGVLLYYQVPVNFLSLMIMWPAAIVVMIAGSLGISCLLAALIVKYRDFRYVIPFVLQIGLFVSPVIYPVSILKNEILNYILALNPMYAAIVLFRNPFVNSPMDGMLIGISILSGLVFLVSGILYFKKTEAYFADIA